MDPKGAILALDHAKLQTPIKLFILPQIDTAINQIYFVSEWKRVWVKVLSNSLAKWKSWELPVRNSKCVQNCVGSQITQEFRPFQYSHQGTAPFLLALYSTFPKSKQTCSDISSHVYSFLIWDDWLKKYANPQEIHCLANFIKSNRLDDSDSISYSFPERLDRKYPGKKDLFIKALYSMKLSLFSQQWFERYLFAWEQYFTEGLSLYSRLLAGIINKSTPSIDEFLVCRAMTHGTLIWSMISSSNQGIVLEDALFKLSSPILLLSSMAASLFSDIFLSSASRSNCKSSMSAVEVYGENNAKILYNSILQALILTKDQVLMRVKQENDYTESAIENFEEYLQLIVASLKGVTVWYKCADRFKGGQIDMSDDLSQAATINLSPLVEHVRNIASWASSYIIQT